MEFYPESGFKVQTVAVTFFRFKSVYIFLAKRHCVGYTESFNVKVGPSSDEKLIKVIETDMSRYSEMAILLTNEFIHKTPICIAPEGSFRPRDSLKLLGTSVEQDK